MLIMKIYWKLAKCWSWKYIEKANMFDSESESEIKTFVLMKGKKINWSKYTNSNPWQFADP